TCTVTGDCTTPLAGAVTATPTSALPRTATDALALSSDATGSIWSAVTPAPTGALPPTVGVKNTNTDCASPAARSPRAHVSMCPASVQLPAVADAKTSVAVAGTSAVATTAVAVSGPWFTTLSCA